MTSDFDNYKKTKKEFPELNIKLIENKRNFNEINLKNKRIIQIDNSLGNLNSIDYVPDAFDHPESVVPERIIYFFKENFESINNSINILKDFNFEEISNEELGEIEDLLENFGENKEILDEELKRLKKSLELLEEKIAGKEEELENEIKGLVNKREITLDGDDVLKILEKNKGINNFLKKEFEEDFEEKIDKKSKEFVNELNLKSEEKNIALNLFKKEIKFPYHVDKETKEKLILKLEKKYEKRKFEVKKNLAKKLKNKKDVVVKIVKKALEIDVAYAIKKFIREYDMSLPKFVENGFSFENGKNLFIDDVEPIDYKVNDVTLLTGVNSGGKTSTLDLVSQIFILSQMGFPVPAKNVKIQLIDEAYYYRSGKGTVDSGAFESILKKLENLFKSNNQKLVLMDELENITEPGASAKIMAGVLELLKKRNQLAIIVSHMAEKINQVTEKKISIDGIEAKGLDDEMNLIIERSPKKGLFAASTPELVVKKLHKKRKSSLYENLYNKFN